MTLKNLKIGTQLMLGYTILLVFVVILGVVAYIQVDKIQQQTDTLYNHPFKVQRAVGWLRFDVMAIQRDMKDLVIVADESGTARNLAQIETLTSNAFGQIEILKTQYLGPRADVDSVEQGFFAWNSMHNETIRMLRGGNTAEAAARMRADSIAANQFRTMLDAVKKIDSFSEKKAEVLFTISNDLNDSLNRQVLLLIIGIFLLSVIISTVIFRNIRTPVIEITGAANRFQNDDMGARSPYESKNELGALSASFNTLAESIQLTTELKEKVADLAGLMLSEYDVKKFFQATLNALATHTGSQMAAIYLLSDDKKTFYHFESTGLDDQARLSFAADSYEGEFGTVLHSRKVHHLKNITEGTRFVFNTVGGKFIPREIITLPIIADNEVVAIISLASVGIYTNPSIELIDSILITLSTRVEGILAFHKIKGFSEALESQNRELEAQKTELAAQSAELIMQNTELEMQKKQLDEASRLKTNFLSNMSHELRTPLNSVIALTGVLNRRLANQIPSEEYSYLSVIERNGKHLLNLINDILDISRIEAGREEVEITKFNPGNLVAEVITMIHPQATEKAIELKQEGSDPTLFINSDADKCRHILQNLVGNAVKFTGKGSVVISTRNDDHCVVFTVTDTGIGISANHLPHIFDEFRQADGSTSRRYGGTGLGLAIAKKYANLLGGTIVVKSTPGKGSEFALTLPLYYAAENRITEPAASAGYFTRLQKHPGEAESPSGKTILLVEDSEPAIIQIRDILEDSGHELLIAHDGSEALGIISHTIPDAMILDLMMPGIDGFDVLKTIREAEPTAGIPVLILTAKHITREELQFLKRNNIHQLIQKGDVNRIELLRAVDSMVIQGQPGQAVPKTEIQPIEGKPVILVVEDNADNMLTVKALLSDRYTVVEAVDGNDGIIMAGKHKPNLILMDIELPGMDGIAAFRAIRNNPELQKIPVLALTASAMVSDRETILSHGFDGYLAKPIDEHLFFDTINKTLYGK